MMLLSNVLFVIENISMILLFYFSPFPAHLVLFTSHDICLFGDYSWSRNETNSLLFLNERIRWLIK